MSSLLTRVLEHANKNNREVYARLVDTIPSRDMNLREINQYLRLVLADAPVCTINERECLMDNLSDGVWMEYFIDTVYPTLVKFNLPVVR